MERKLRVIKDSVVGKPVTKSKGWKLEQKLKLGREQEDYSYLTSSDEDQSLSTPKPHF